MKKYLFFTFIILYLLISIHSQMMQDINNKKLKNINNNSSEGFDNKLIIPSDNGGMFGILEPTDKFTLNVIKNEFNIFNGKKTDLLIYETFYKNIKYLNPVIKIKKDSIFKADLSNGLNEETIIHWHGILSDSHNDGIPQQAISTGNNYNYDFKVLNRGGTYWYHPHPHKKTAKQVYMGLAGFFIIEDDDVLKLNNILNLKFGLTDIPLLIQDKRFNNQNELLYNPNMDEQIMGFYGENILVNLTPKPYLDVESRIYRLRILNGSNSRTYKLAFLNKQNKLKYYIIGTDGGLLDKAYLAEDVFISPGERVDILIDFGKLNIGDTVYLKSIKFDPMHNEDMGMMDHSMNNMNTSNDSILPEGSEYFIMKFNVKYEVKEKNQIPEVLSAIKPIEKNNLKIRKFVLSLSGMQWLINGLSFRMNDYPVEVKKNTKEIWEFYNSKKSMPHPMHIHGIQFQVIERINSPDQIKKLSIDKNGHLVTDLGWKDTVQVWPDETVRIIIDFSNNYSGIQNYVFHCHILEHEDMGMMINYRIIDL